MKIITPLFFILIYLLSCRSAVKKDAILYEKCDQDIVIVNSKTIKEIERYFQKDNFFQKDSSQYYMYEITLDSNLKVINVRTIFKNNYLYSLEFRRLLVNLNFKRINANKNCIEYKLPFIIQARLKKLIYPQHSDFYKADLPIE